MQRRRRDPYTGDLFTWSRAEHARAAWTPPTFALLDPAKVEVRPYADIALRAWERLERFGIVADTASGKTYLALMLADRVLAAGRRVLMSAPTSTLCEQHAVLARDVFRLPPERIVFLQGRWTPKRRAREWAQALIAIATPQTLANDIARDIVPLGDAGLVVIDECHGAAKRHASIAIAHAAADRDVRILALTASPGGTTARIERTRQNLLLTEWVRIAEHETNAFRPPVIHEQVRVPLPGIIVRIVAGAQDEDEEERTTGLEDALERITTILAEHKLLREPSRLPSLRHLNDALEHAVQTRRTEIVPYVVAALQLHTVLTSVITDDYSVTLARLERARNKRWKPDPGSTVAPPLTITARRLRATPEIQRAHLALTALVRDNVIHPKQDAVRAIIRDALARGTAMRGLIYNRYVAGARRLHELLTAEFGPHFGLVLGRSAMKTDEAMAQLRALAEGRIRFVIATDAIREGIHIPALDLLIMYSPPRNAIELIQLAGRVGRTQPGRVYQILAQHPVDERYAVTATAAAKRMRTLIPPTPARPMATAGQRRSHFSGAPGKDARGFIAALDGAFVFERFRVDRAEVVAKPRRRPYLRLHLSDRTGWITLYHWCPQGIVQAEAIATTLSRGTVAIVAGTLERTGTERRIIVNPRDGQHVTPCPEGDFDPRDYA